MALGSHPGGPKKRTFFSDRRSVTSRLYAGAIAAGQAAGDLRRGMDPEMLAWFFGALRMVVQFAGCCD